MFNKEHMADVHFIVGPPGESQKVPAHKVSALFFCAKVSACWLCVD